MKNEIIVGITCLLLGGAGGYLATQGRDIDNTNPTAGSQQTMTQRSSGSSKAGGAMSDGAGAPQSYAEVVNMPGQTARIQALIQLYSDLDPGAFAAEAEKLDQLPFSERILAAYLLFAAWAEVSPVDAMDHARTKMGFAGNFIRPTVLQSWAASDPAGAADHFLNNKADFAMMGMMGRRGRGPRDDSGAAVVAGEWAKQDPAAALAWAATLDGRDADTATAKALGELAKTDPAEAARRLGQVEQDSRDAAYRSIAQEWAKQDWTATESWINGLPEDAQDEALISALGSLASEDPQTAAQKTLTLLEGDERDEAMETVAGQLAESDPSGAMTWLMENASEDGQIEGVGDVMRPWVSSDPQGALDWINGQPVGEVRDAAVRSFVFNDNQSSPEMAVNLAETMDDERQRDRVLGMAAGRWLAEDKDAATAYLETTDRLSDRAKERVLRNR